MPLSRAQPCRIKLNAIAMHKIRGVDGLTIVEEIMTKAEVFSIQKARSGNDVYNLRQRRNSKMTLFCCFLPKISYSLDTIIDRRKYLRICMVPWVLAGD